MSKNRRREGRRKFKINKNYIVQFVCVVITCVTIIVSTIVISSLKTQLEVQENNIANNINNNTIEDIKITDEDKRSINDLITFLASNIDIGENLKDKNVQYSLTSKYINCMNSSLITKVPAEYINYIEPQKYTDLGYVYFEDYKDSYMCISKNDFITYYGQLFNIENLQIDLFNDYYIKDIDSYVIFKNIDYNSNSVYKVGDVYIDNDTNKYVSNNYEINILKVYNDINYDLVEDFLNRTSIDSSFYTGITLKINLVNNNNKFVFDSYCL